MPNREKRAKKPEKPIDKVFGKRGRGRPRKVIPTEIRGRSENYRHILAGVWVRLWPRLSEVQTEADVIEAFTVGARPYEREFVPAFAALVLKVLREPRFPKKRREAQIAFLADSLAGVGWVTPRTSRDICERGRAKEKRAHHIIRYEFYVECSCHYKGHSKNHACPKCGATIPLPVGSSLNPEFF
jgi:hypothetical protein